jgi:hypothetical protein
MGNRFFNFFATGIFVGAVTTFGTNVLAVNDKCKVDLGSINSSTSVTFEEFAQAFANFGPRLFPKQDYMADIGRADNWALVEVAVKNAQDAIYTIPVGNQVAFLVGGDRGSQRVVIGQPSAVTEPINRWIDKPQLVQHDKLVWSFGAPDKKINLYSHHPRVEDPVQNLGRNGRLVTGIAIYHQKTQQTEIIPYNDIIAHTSDLGDRTTLFVQTFVGSETSKDPNNKIWFLKHIFRQVFGNPELGIGGNSALAEVYVRDTQKIVDRLNLYETLRRPLAFLIKQPADTHQVLMIGFAHPVYQRVNGFDSIRRLAIIGVDGTNRSVGIEHIIKMTSDPIDQYTSRDPAQLLKEFAQPQYHLPSESL